MGKFTKKERKKFAPLQKYEDRMRALWIAVGGGIAVIGFLIGRYA